MKNIDSIGHVTGKSIYVDDIPTINGTLYGVVYASPIAHGKIENIDYKETHSPMVSEVAMHLLIIEKMKKKWEIKRTASGNRMVLSKD